MTKHTQLILDDDKGDCFRTCLACILDLPVRRVPNFMRFEDWKGETQKWLGKRGLQIVGIMFPDPQILSRSFFEAGTDCILTGVSPRRRGDNGNIKYHAVVGRAVGYGVEVIHDPHPSRAGLQDWGYRWVRFIVPKAS